MDDVFNDIISETMSNVQLASIEVEKSARDFVRPGWSGQLKGSIFTLPPIKTKNKIIGIIMAHSNDVNEQDYFEKQHNEELHHFLHEGSKTTSGYADAGSGSSAESRYNDGYKKEKENSPKYAVKFMDKGLDDSSKRVFAILGAT